MPDTDKIRYDIWHLEMQIQRLSNILADRRAALVSAIRERNEPMLVDLPEESATILRKAADYGLFIVRAP